jgi:hypothetical protein
MSSITLVTCLYNIDRETKGDGRKWVDYLEWFGKTLLLQENMVIFIDKSLESFVEEKRSPLKQKTKIVIRPFTELPCYKHYDQMKSILSKLVNPTDVSLKFAEYQVLMHSKSGMLQECMSRNYFETSLFCWIDGGSSRFWKDLDPKKQWPHQDYRERIEKSNRVWIQPFPMSKNNYTSEDIGKCQTRVYATVFMGNKNVMTLLCGLLDDVLQNKMLKVNRLDNEQVSLSLIGTKYRCIFQYLSKHKPGWLNFQLKAHKLIFSDILSKPFDSKMHFNPKP